MRLIIMLLLVLPATQSPGQLQKTIHQTFAVPDSVATIELNLYGDFGLESWPGNVVMSETRISLYNASDGILQHLLKSQRYDLAGEVAGDSLRIHSITQERPEVKKGGTAITELVDVRLFVPIEFEQAGPTTWIRKEEADPPREQN